MAISKNYDIFITTNYDGNSVNVVNSAVSSSQIVSTGFLSGPSGTTSVGTVTSLPAGSAPTVTNSGTPSGAILNFGIPAGKPGDSAGSLTSSPTRTSDFTASPNTYYPVDARSGAITVTLPTSTTGQEIAIKKTDASTNLVTISGTLNGVTSSTLPLRTPNQGKVLIPDGTGGWNVYAGDLSLASLDARYQAAGNTVSDATTTSKGIVQLAGDLAGTATAPTVSVLHTGSNGQLLRYNNGAPMWDYFSNVASDATTTAKGVVQLSGDLGGTASSPTVPALANKANLVSPAFTGTPTVPTPAASDNSTTIANTSFVTSAILAAASSYDDVKEYANLSAFPATGKTDTIYVADDTGYIYRWSGSTYIQVGGSNPADATTTSKGIVQLAGDLGGINSTAASPILKNVTKVFNVLDYGATTGSSDNSTFFQNAFNAANTAGGGIVQVPAGTYVFTNPITIPTNVWVRGLGYKTSILSTSMTANNNRGILNISNGSNIKITSIGFVANGGTAGLNSYGHTDLVVEDCGFTGTSNTASGGILNYIGNAGAATRTWINRCSFYDIPTQNARTICLSPKNGNHLEDVKITNCYFTNNGGPCISLNTTGPAPSPNTTSVPASVGYARRVLVQGNTANNVLQGNVTGDVTTGSLVLGGISAVNTIFDMIIDSNFYYNTNASVVSGGIAFVYGVYGLVVSNNVGRGVYVPGGTINQGPFVSPGRVGNPCVNVSIINNRITGFNSPWDADSMVNCKVSGNTVYRCGNPFFLGYANQQNVDIHDNVFHNSITWDTNQTQGYSFSGSAAPIKCKVHDNLIIDDRGILPPTNVSAVTINGGSLTSGTTYYYKVTALDGFGETLGSSEVSATPSGTNLAVQINFGRMIGAIQYNIYRTTTSGSYGSSSLIGSYYYAYGGPASNNIFRDTGLALLTGTVPTSSTAALPKMTIGLKLFGGSDFSDVVFTNNRFYLPHGTFSSILVKESGSEIVPREMYNNEYHDQNGIVFDSKIELQSNKGAANGYAPLDSTSRVPLVNLPMSVINPIPLIIALG